MDDWLRFFFWGWGVHVTAFLILEVGALATLRDRLRLYALVPAPIMALVLLKSARSFLSGDPTWPLTIVMAAPLLVFVVGVLWFRGLHSQRHPRARQLGYVAVAVLVGSFLVSVLHSFV